MEWVHKQLLKIRFYSQFIEWTKVCVLPGFSPLPLYTVSTFFFREIAKDTLINKASSLAYSFMLAIFPGLIFLFTLIPFIPIKGFQDQLLNLIALILPDNAFSAFETTLKDIVKNQNRGLLSFGFLSAIFFATNGVTNLMKAFNKSSLIVETRSWLKQRIIAFILTVVICLSIIVCISAMVFSSFLISYLNKDLHVSEKFVIYLIVIIRWILLASLYFMTISILYRYGPAHTKKWKLFSAGSWLATVLAFITIWAFSFYINNFGSYNKVYGSIGTLLVVMIWLYLNSLILLIGFELNASVDVSKRSVKIIRPTFNLFKKPNPSAVNTLKK